MNEIDDAATALPAQAHPAAVSAREARTAAVALLVVLTVSAAAFFVPAGALAALLIALLGVWAISGVAVRDLLVPMRRVFTFAALVFVSFALFSPPGSDALWEGRFFGVELRVTVAGMTAGALAGARLAAVVLASSWLQARAHPAAVLVALRQMRCPEGLAVILQACLSSVGTRARGADREAPRQRLSIAGLQQRFRDNLQRAARDLAAAGYTGPPERAAQFAVLAGVASFLVGTRVAKVLPGIPFAPGFKQTLATPVLILARALSGLPAAGTTVGLASGVMGVLMGDCRFGVFEIGKHVAAGATVDVLVPRVAGFARHWPLLTYGVVGVMVSLARLTTVVLVALLLRVPNEFYAVLVPMAASQLFFGLASGSLSAGLVRAFAGQDAVSAVLGQRSGGLDGGHTQGPEAATPYPIGVDGGVIDEPAGVAGHGQHAGDPDASGRQHHQSGRPEHHGSGPCRAAAAGRRDR